MKLITYIMTIVTMLAGFALADAAKTKYVVGMTGVTWGGCKTHVRAAFAKLKGVDSTTIKIESDGAGGQKVTFDSTEKGITKDEAVKSLGAEASKYIVQNLKAEAGSEKKGDKKEEKKGEEK